MPIFEFRCHKCSHTFEKYNSTAGSGDAACPKCGSEETEKVFSVFSSQCAAPAGGSSGGCGSGGFS